MVQLSRTVSKLGKDVWSFSIPAVRTCPGSSPACRTACYARKGRFLFGNVKNRLEANLAAAKLETFAADLTAAIAREGVTRLRIHSSGDFFNPAYVWAWVRAAKASPTVKMWGYTRSWRRPGFAPALRALAACKNVRLWYSADADTGVPARVPKGVRVAYLQTDHADRPTAAVDLVFRTPALRGVTRKTVAGARVCPTETGLPGAHDVTCATCTLCSDPPPPSRGRLALPLVK